MIEWTRSMSYKNLKFVENLFMFSSFNKNSMKQLLPQEDDSDVD